MKRPTALTVIILSAALTASLATPALAELTFGQWASREGFRIPGSTDWICGGASQQGITSLDGVGDYTNLRLLNLVNNQIHTLDADEFQGLSRLKTLLLFGNRIGSLAAGQFRGAEDLHLLDLDGNQISSIEAGAFEGLTGMAKLDLSDNQLSSLNPGQFQGLASLQWLDLRGNQTTSIEAGTFHGLSDLHFLNLAENQIASLDLTGFVAPACTSFSIADNPITEVILAEAILSGDTFETLMIGSPLGPLHTCETLDALMIGNPVLGDGISDLPGIARMDFSRADLSGVDQLDRMFTMADLESLTLTDVVFSNTIVAGGYAEVWDLISALDAKKLDALTVNQQLYAAMRTNLDAWDAGPGNVLTVVPEPSAIALLACAGLALLLRRRRG